MDIKGLMEMMEKMEEGNGKSGGIRSRILEGLKREELSLEEMKERGFSRSLKSLSSYMSYLKKGDNMNYRYVISGGGEGSNVKRRLIGRISKKSGVKEVWYEGGWKKELKEDIVNK